MSDDTADEPPGSDDPRCVSTVAVTTDDAVTALEAVRRGDRPVVLRVTPPFAGRMRARLHVRESGGRSDDCPDPIHLPPEQLVTDDAPAYPEVDATEDDLRAAESAYSTAAHRDRHAAEVEAWRSEIRDHLVDAVTVRVGTDDHRIDVSWLG